MPTTHPDPADSFTDIGPAPLPPAWCEPGAQPNRDSAGGDNGFLWSWTRDFGDDGVVWIACDDFIANGRLMRSSPGISYDEEPGALTPMRARQLAAALLNAADVLEDSIITVDVP